MMIEMFNRDWGTEFVITPETPVEVAELFRLTNNAKSEKPDMFLSFNGKPYVSITMNKVAEKVRVNSVRPRNHK